MVNFDLYAILGEIKAEQVKILALLQDQMKEVAEPKVYDLVQLQEILHVSKRTIATWLKEGILPHSRVSGKIWVTETQLTVFLERNSNASEEARESKKQRGVTVHDRK